MFIHPWAILIGIAAVSLPVLVHWLTKPRPRRIPLSTLRFIRQAVEDRRARHRLRNFLILALRTLAVMLLAAAIARPLIGEPKQTVAEDHADTARVVLMDVSQSMAAGSGSLSAFERGRTVAAKHLEYTAGLKANLILAGSRPRAVFKQPSHNFTALRDELADAGYLPEALKVQPALNAAGEMLAAAGSGDIGRELVIISDFQRANWANADFSPLPADTVIKLESVVQNDDSSNLAILGVRTQGRAQVNCDLRLEVEVGNFSKTPRDVQVEVTLGKASYRLRGHCSPRGRTTLSEQIVPREVGWLVGEAKLVGIEDALATDNSRPCVLSVGKPPVYLLITRQFEAQRPSSSYYLERALIPVEPRPGREQARVLRASPAELETETMAGADLLVLDHPGRLDNGAINKIASMMRRGRGVLYIAAESADAGNLKQLADSAGSALQMPVEFSPPRAGQLRQGLFFTEADQNQAPFEVFGDNLMAGLGPIRISGGLASQRLETGLSEEILARLSDGSAFLTATHSDGGSLVVMNADLEKSNLPGSAMFVPLIGELVERLMARSGSAREFTGGEPMAVYLPAEIGNLDGLQLIGPDGEPDEIGHLQQEKTGILWRADNAGMPGIHQVQRYGKTIFAVATALPAEESDLRVLSPEVFQDRLSGGRTMEYRSATLSAPEEEDVAWSWFAAICVGCLLCELAVLKVFRI